MDNSNEKTNLNEQNNQESAELTNQDAETELVNEEQNQKNSYQITESTVNIEFNDDVKNNNDRDIITESTVNIQSSDEDNNKDSHSITQQTSTTTKRNSITESTVVISTYQANDENNSFVDFETNKQESNTNSMIIANASSSSSESLPSPVDKEFSSSENEDQDDNQKQLSNEADDVVNLVNSYDIPNFSSINNNANSRNEAKEEEIVKPKRNLEEETYLKILGNDSLMKKITEYGVEDDEPNARPRNGQMVTISYDAFLQENNKLVDHNTNLTFILGDGDVISGN
jgi:hypothetical protein